MTTKLTELLNLPPLGDENERLNELDNEENVKREIINGKSTKHIARKYEVSINFINACRRELRNEGEL